MIPCVAQDESVTFCGPVTEEDPALLLQQNAAAKTMFGLSDQQSIADVAAAEAVSTTDVQTAWTQLAASMQQILDKLNVDNKNQDLYGKLRQCTTLAVSLPQSATQTTCCDAHSPEQPCNHTYTQTHGHTCPLCAMCSCVQDQTLYSEGQ